MINERKNAPQKDQEGFNFWDWLFGKKHDDG